MSNAYRIVIMVSVLWTDKSCGLLYMFIQDFRPDVTPHA